MNEAMEKLLSIVRSSNTDLDMYTVESIIKALSLKELEEIKEYISNKYNLNPVHVFITEASIETYYAEEHVRKFFNEMAKYHGATIESPTGPILVTFEYADEHAPLLYVSFKNMRTGEEDENIPFLLEEEEEDDVMDNALAYLLSLVDI